MELLPLPVQALSCGYSRFHHEADTLPSQQLSPRDPRLWTQRFMAPLMVISGWLFDSSPFVQLLFWHHPSLASYHHSSQLWGHYMCCILERIFLLSASHAIDPHIHFGLQQRLVSYFLTISNIRQGSEWLFKHTEPYLIIYICICLTTSSLMSQLVKDNRACSSCLLIFDT